jgi:cytochrome c biogenesis protein CcmG, thiol:disulfide interchange protein DsbE
LPNQALKALRQTSFFVPRWNDHRDRRSVLRLDESCSIELYAVTHLNRHLDYYKSVKRLFSSALVISLILLAGCNSGSHPPRIGNPAPDFSITDSQHTVALSQFRGKPVLLNFWATWCPPCIEEMPSLVQLQRQMGDKVTILAVSEDADDGAYKQFVHDHGVDLLTIRDTQQKNELYGTFKFPETFVIDRNGNIVRKFIGATDWTSPAIVDYLNKL